jgi:drug/metabolite transporter (DMT)-like permease
VSNIRNIGVGAALIAAVLFGLATPAAKHLLGDVSPWLLAGLLYCGSGIGLFAYRFVRRAPRLRLPRGDLPALAGAILCGGVVAPVLLLVGLSNTPASSASLLLNAEGSLTALVAWTVFRENVDLRVGGGMAAIVVGAVLLSVQNGVAWGSAVPSLLILGACAFWALDNNLTRAVALNDATWLAGIKGAVAGPVNVGLALAIGDSLPPLAPAVSALVLGLFSYGVSLALFVVALRHLGAARAGGYFGIAPFIGAGAALALGEPLTWAVVAAGALMALGTWLHLTDQHAHPHVHGATDHAHWHHHDAHHLHSHDAADPPTRWGWHAHQHHHPAMTHAHAHVPDAHHRHRHS